MVKSDPKKRWSLSQVLEHEFFANEEIYDAEPDHKRRLALINNKEKAQLCQEKQLRQPRLQQIGNSPTSCSMSGPPAKSQTHESGLCAKLPGGALAAVTVAGLVLAGMILALWRRKKEAEKQLGDGSSSS